MIRPSRLSSLSIPQSKCFSVYGSCFSIQDPVKKLQTLIHMPAVRPDRKDTAVFIDVILRQKDAVTDIYPDRHRILAVCFIIRNAVHQTVLILLIDLTLRCSGQIKESAALSKRLHLIPSHGHGVHLACLYHRDEGFIIGVGRSAGSGRIKI